MRQVTALSCRKLATGFILHFPTTSARGGHGLCKARVHVTGENRDPSFLLPSLPEPQRRVGSQRRAQGTGQLCQTLRPQLPHTSAPAASVLQRWQEGHRERPQAEEEAELVPSGAAQHPAAQRAGLPMSKQGEVGCSHPRDSQFVQRAVQLAASPSTPQDPSSSPGT